MCQERNSREMHSIIGRTVKVDRCLQPIVDLINSATKFKTCSCCCGHGRYHMTIILKDKNGTVFDLISNQRIPQKKRFYKKDKQGYYYIPEVENAYE